jgi:hypothetical protein
MCIWYAFQKKKKKKPEFFMVVCMIQKKGYIQPPLSTRDIFQDPPVDA